MNPNRSSSPSTADRRRPPALGRRRLAVVTAAVVALSGIVVSGPEASTAGPIIATAAGGPGSGAPATSTAQTPLDVEVRGGTLYVADRTHKVVRAVDPATGIETVVAGNGRQGSSGDGGLATSAEVSVARVAADPAGNLFLLQSGRVRQVDAASGIITAYAGTTTAGFSGDGGPATEAQFDQPAGVATDGAGNLFIADWANNRVRRVDAATEVITTYAGGGSGGDGGLATDAQLGAPQSLTVDGAGNLFIAGGETIRRVDSATRIITTVAGGGTVEGWKDGYPATSLNLGTPQDIAVDDAGNLFLVWYSRIRRIDATTTIITTIVGDEAYGPGGDGRPATEAQVDHPLGVTTDGAGNVYIADTNNNRVRFVNMGSAAVTLHPGTPQSQTVAPGYITTAAGTGSQWGAAGDGGPASSAQLNHPRGVATDGAGTLYIADSANHRVRRVDAVTGLITTVAGTGSAGFDGDGGLATQAVLNFPWGVTLDRAGNLYVSDADNARVRFVNLGAVPVTLHPGTPLAQTVSPGYITTVAGSGPCPTSPPPSGEVIDGTIDQAENVADDCLLGDGGPATAATLAGPRGLGVDRAGNLFIADTDNRRVRRVDAGTGLITTYAGGGLTSKDGVGAAEAVLGGPQGVAVDGAGNLFIAETSASRIRRVDPATTIITTVAGIGTEGFSGDNGAATSAKLKRPSGLALTDSGALLVADTLNHRLRQVLPGDDGVVNAGPGETITTVAGTGGVGSFSGDGGPATSAELHFPMAVAVGCGDRRFVADTNNSRIRRVGGRGTCRLPAVADFDGNASTDVGIYRPTGGKWFVRNGDGFPVTYGTQDGDVPVPGDYDGNRTTDVAIYRPLSGQWFVRNVAGFPVTYGTQDGDVPVPGDYDGNGSTDVAIYRPGSGTWFVRGVAGFPVTYGTKDGDIPVPGDYDDNGTTDVAIYRPTTGQWFVRNVAGFPVTYGTHDGDIPVPGDYDKDGDTDVAVFRAGTWFVRDVAGFPVTYGTQKGDIPLQLPYAIRRTLPSPS